MTQRRASSFPGSRFRAILAPSNEGTMWWRISNTLLLFAAFALASYFYIELDASRRQIKHLQQYNEDLRADVSYFLAREAGKSDDEDVIADPLPAQSQAPRSVMPSSRTVGLVLVGAVICVLVFRCLYWLTVVFVAVFKNDVQRVRDLDRY